MKKESRKIFWVSMGVSLAVMIFVFGIISVDYQGRRLSFGDTALPLQKVYSSSGVALEINLLGVKKTLDITKIDKFWKLFLDFSCIPHV